MTPLSRQQQLHLLDGEPLESLQQMADACRAVSCGDAVHLRGIIEISNVCRRRCAYCGINADNAAASRYRMSAEQVRTIAAQAVDRGVRTIVLQSGEDPELTATAIARLVSAIKRLGDVAVTLSCGAFSRDDYRIMRDAGADRYLLKFETSNERLYGALHADSTLAERLECLADLDALGFQTGSGSLVGLPGQAPADVVEDLRLAAALDLDMATFSPFIPHPQTPLAAAGCCSPEMALRVVALARLMLPAVHIPASTALATVCADGYRRALGGGANVVMANLTPLDAARQYQLYPGKSPAAHEADRDMIAELKRAVRSLGRPLATDRGDSIRRNMVLQETDQ